MVAVDGRNCGIAAPRGGRRADTLGHRGLGCAGRVSIHAPARGATGRRGGYPHRGRTGGFNPRPRAGGDRIDQRNNRRLRQVSIHAPARGATGSISAIIVAFGKFQSTPPRGGRLLALPGAAGTYCFNPRPRAGGDSTRSSDFAAARPSFNPRPRAGGDLQGLSGTLVIGLLFQSTPPRGGRRVFRRVLPRAEAEVSIHAPARGATTIKADSIDPPTKFQSTPPRGGRLMSRTSSPSGV